MFEILETQKIIEGEARITLLPRSDNLLGRLLAATARNEAPPQRANDRR